MERAGWEETRFSEDEETNSKFEHRAPHWPLDMCVFVTRLAVHYLEEPPKSKERGAHQTFFFFDSLRLYDVHGRTFLLEMS